MRREWPSQGFFDSGWRSRDGRSVKLQHVLAVMGRVADEPTASRVHDKVEGFENDLTDRDGNFVRHFHRIDGATPTLNGDANRPVDVNGGRAGARHGALLATLE